MTYVRWRDEDGNLHVASAETDANATWDLSNAPPLRAGMTISIGGVQMVLSDPQT